MFKLYHSHKRVRLSSAAALLALFAIPTVAHTWIEEYQVIGPNGSYIGDRGFSRGYTARTDADFNGDANILWMLPQLDARMPDGTVRLRVNSSDSLCHPNQRTSNYTNPQYPMLKVAPGNFVAMKYLENGHVTLPWNQIGKPADGGTVLVYATTKPINDEKIVNVMKWNRDGTGGDGRGWLLSTQNFDDGRCHQINNCVLSVERQTLFPNMIPLQNVSTEQWCESDVQIPKNIKPGTLTTYWVWQWPTEPGKECTFEEGKDEYYTTCADFEIVADSPGNVKIAEEIATNTLVQENFQTQAVSTYMQRTAHTVNPIIVQNWNINATATMKQLNPVFTASCQSVLMAEQSSVAAILATGGRPPPPPSCPAGKWATGTLSNIIVQSVLNAMKTKPSAPTTPAPSGPQATAPPIATGGPAETGRPQGPPHHRPGPPQGPPTSAPAGGTSVVTVTTFFTRWMTTTEQGGVAPSSGAPPAASNGLSTVRTIGASPSSGTPPVDTNGLSTVRTIGASTSSTPMVPTVGASGVVGGHLARHVERGRGHPRNFA